jgi:Xaa-Pro aminopeptidase
MNFVVIPRKGDPIAITSSLEEHRCRKESSIDDIRLWTLYPDIKSDGKTALDVLKSTLNEKKINSVYTDSKIGLGRGIKASKNEFVTEMRGVKTEDELERMKKAIKQSDAGQEFARNLVECGEGLTEREVRTEIDYFMGRNGIQENSFTTIIASGSNAAYSHHSNTNRKLESGDPVICDFGVFWDGYCSDITRTYFVNGEPSTKLKEIYQVVLEANKRSIHELKAGSSGHKIDKAGRDFIRSKGYGRNFVHGTGHGFGLEIHEFPSLTYKSKVIAKESMAVTIEPGIYIPGKGGVRIEDDVLVKGDNPQVLTKAKKDLY